MEQPVDISKLTDAPYDESSKFPFEFADSVVQSFALEILHGPPTCYLISGYRGVGKSSFVRKVESHITKIRSKTADPQKAEGGSKTELNSNNITDDLNKMAEVLFIHLNFTNYKTQQYLLRRLIRATYQSVIKKENEAVYTKLNDPKDKNNPIQILERLYTQTFHEVASSKLYIEEDGEKREITTDRIQFCGFVLIGIFTFVNAVWNLLRFDIWLTVVSGFISLYGVFEKWKSISVTKTRLRSEQKRFLIKTLYDDEISDYHFNSLLDAFFSKEVKTVFVIDELDKVSEDEVDPLLNEMKPYLVCGKCTFIVVGGQKLYFRFQTSQRIDDAVMSTLFSRVIHIPLPKIQTFRNILAGIIEYDRNRNSTESLSENFLFYMVFKSKRVPRHFINLIRTNITWGDSCLIETGKSFPDQSLIVSLTEIITEIDEKDIATEYSEGFRDFLVMQLFIIAEKIVQYNRPEKRFSIEDLLMDTVSDKTNNQKKE